MKPLLIAAGLSLTATPALAHPHKPDSHTAAPEKKAWPFFGNKAKTPTNDSVEWDGEALGEDLKEAARELETAIAESGLLSDMAEMLAEFAEDVEVKKDDADGMRLLFDGDEMLRLKVDRDMDRDERVSLSGLGRNMTVERETLVVDGKTRTRIVIEMDGADGVEVELPEGLAD